MEIRLEMQMEWQMEMRLVCSSGGQMATQTVQMKDVLMEMRLVCLSDWLMETEKDSEMAQMRTGSKDLKTVH